MNEFIEELKHYQNINKERNLDNTVEIGYVIAALEEIKEKLLDKIGYFDYHNRNLTNEQYQVIQKIKDYLTDKGVFK